jgi:hypothetical protein
MHRKRRRVRIARAAMPGEVGLVRSGRRVRIVKM